MCYSIPENITKIMLFLTDTYMRKIRNKIFKKWDSLFLISSFRKRSNNRDIPRTEAG